MDSPPVSSTGIAGLTENGSDSFTNGPVSDNPVPASELAEGPPVIIVSFANGHKINLRDEATKVPTGSSVSDFELGSNELSLNAPKAHSMEKVVHFEADPSSGFSHRSPPGTPVQSSYADLAGLDTVAENKPNSYFAQRMANFKNRKAPSFSAISLKADIQMDEHTIPLGELYARLETCPTMGLSDEEAKLRLRRDGKNTMPPPKHVPEVIKFLMEMLGGFSPLLLAGSLLCFVAFFIQLGSMGLTEVPYDNLYLAVVLFLVVVVTAVFLYAQKAKSERIMDSFKKMIPEHATVVRNGQDKRVLADELVLGDIVEIRGGDRVPADIRLFDAKGLKVDNSSLTGESEAQPRKPVPSENPLDSLNLCFFTTNAVEGWGRGVVIRRGDRTVIGSIATTTAQLQHVETTIAREINAFVRLISILAMVTGVIFLTVPLALGRDFLITIILAISLIVGNVPGGVVIAVAVVLTLTAQRMAKNNCLMKNLEAVESLGACSIICTDKTGTLTQNRMTVSHCWVDNNLIDIDTGSENLAGKDLPSTQTMKNLIRVACLCNRARFKIECPGGPIYSREVVGDASETALLKFVEAIGGRSHEVRRTHPAAVEIPFNSLTKFQVSIHEMSADESPTKEDRYLLVMKGAPEKIWSLCTTIMVDGKELVINDEWNKKFVEAYERLGGMGERCLGCCQLWLPTRSFPIPTQFDAENPNFPLEDLTFLGLFSLIDPLRCTVPDAVMKCRAAGIRIIMVTGDHPVTAKAVARGCGILSDQSETAEDIAERLKVAVSEVNPRDAKAAIITGDQLRTMGDLQLDTILRTHPEIIFARTSPIQKLVIVEACQRLGVVAVTGDGANDSPALKKAQIGVAMGITGSDVSKQAADMVLLDDNFSSIVTGIEEGRLVFDNLKKTICYNIVSNVPQVMPVVLYFLLDLPLGMTTIPMLLLNVVTDMIPSVSMAHESAEEDIMKLPPRNINDRLVNARLVHCAYMQAGIICTTGAYFAYFVCFAQNGFRPSMLFGLRAAWEDPNVHDLQDSYGQEWNYTQRMELQRLINTVFFVSAVVFQWGDVVMRKVRRESIFNKGMRNWLLNFALVVETLITIFVTCTPGLNTALTLHSIKFIWWLPVLPFGLLFCIWDEMRRFWIRRNPGGWLEREFYF